MNKTKRAAKDYKCEVCKRNIRKGEQYAKRSISIGQPWKPDEMVRTPDGGIAFEMQGVRFTRPICADCNKGGK